MRRLLSMILLMGILAFPPAGAQSMTAPQLVVAPLLLGLPMPPEGSLARLAALAVLSPIDQGEAIQLRESLAEPLALLELPRIPPELIGATALQQIGHVVGPRVADVSPKNLLAANALLGVGEFVPASSLMRIQDRAGIGNEPVVQQQLDMAALYGTFDAPS